MGILTGFNHMTKSRSQKNIEMSKEWVGLYKQYKDKSCLDHAIYHVMLAQKIFREIYKEKI